MPFKHFNIILACLLVFVMAIGIFIITKVFESNETKKEVFVCGNTYDEVVVTINDTDTIIISGQAVFQLNCASCHHLHKDATGPNLSTAMNTRTTEWLYQFLTDTSFHPKDDLARSLKEKYEVECPKFPYLTEQEIEAVHRYVDH